MKVYGLFQSCGVPHRTLSILRANEVIFLRIFSAIRQTTTQIDGAVAASMTIEEFESLKVGHETISLVSNDLRKIFMCFESEICAETIGLIDGLVINYVYGLKILIRL